MPNDFVQRPAATTTFTIKCANGAAYVELPFKRDTDESAILSNAAAMAELLTPLTLGNVSGWRSTYSSLDPTPVNPNPDAIAEQKANLSFYTDMAKAFLTSIPAANPAIFREDGSLDEDNAGVAAFISALTGDSAIWCDSNGQHIKTFTGGIRYNEKTGKRRRPKARLDLNADPEP